MKRTYAFLMFCLVAEFVAVCAVLAGSLPAWAVKFEVPTLCGLTAGVGGLVYCLRGLYVNTCAGDGWSPTWMPWYFIRPFISPVCGVVSYLLLKAGLFVLESSPREDGSHLGFYVLAFISGLNVDKFLTKIEDVARTTWGIEKSRAACRDDAPVVKPLPR